MRIAHSLDAELALSSRRLTAASGLNPDGWRGGMIVRLAGDSAGRTG